MKRLESVLPPELKESLRNAMSACSGESTLQGVLMLAELMENTMRHLEKGHPGSVDWQLFSFMVDRLRMRCP
jgi:hypothetical protein